VEISFAPGRPRPQVQVHTITGPEPGATNTLEDRTRVATHVESHEIGHGQNFSTTVPALSVNGFIFEM
jgi:alpha-L-arabinofuranosidase